MSDDVVPMSCSLSESDAVSQATEWTELVGFATAVEALPTGARMRFPLDMAASVTDLAERESTCCAFLDFDVHRTADGLLLEVTTANPDAWAVISLLTGMDRP